MLGRLHHHHTRQLRLTIIGHDLPLLLKALAMSINLTEVTYHIPITDRFPKSMDNLKSDSRFREYLIHRMRMAT